MVALSRRQILSAAITGTRLNPLNPWMPSHRATHFGEAQRPSTASALAAVPVYFEFYGLMMLRRDTQSNTASVLAINSQFNPAKKLETHSPWLRVLDGAVAVTGSLKALKTGFGVFVDLPTGTAWSLGGDVTSGLTYVDDPARGWESLSWVPNLR